MAEEMVLAYWEARTDKQLGKYSRLTPYSIIEAKLFLKSDELANPDKDVATFCRLTLRYMYSRPIKMAKIRTIEINASLNGDTLCYHNIPILCAANTDFVAFELVKQAEEWWTNNG